MTDERQLRRDQIAINRSRAAGHLTPAVGTRNKLKKIYCLNDADERTCGPMELRIRRPWASSLVRGAFLSLTSAAFLTALALTAAPQWHEWIHPDANSARHECAVTLINSGGYEKISAAPLVAAPLPVFHFCFVPALHPVWVASPFVCARLLEHAPPAIALA